MSRCKLMKGCNCNETNNCSHSFPGQKATKLVTIYRVDMFDDAHGLTVCDVCAKHIRKHGVYA